MFDVLKILVDNLYKGLFISLVVVASIFGLIGYGCTKLL